MKTPERVVEEVASLRASFLLFTDDNFLLSIPRAKRVAELLREKGIRKRITFQARSDTIVDHPEIISLWAKSGLWKVFIGFEKIEDADLSALKKSNTVKNNEEALKILRENKIEVCASFIVDPQYERKDFERLRQYIRHWKLYCPSLTILTPVPGTDLFLRMKEKLTTQNLELFDMTHAVLPTRLSLAEFYREFSKLYKIGYLNIGLGWDGLKAWMRKIDSFHQLWKVMRTAMVMGDGTYYLTGHKENLR